MRQLSTIALVFIAAWVSAQGTGEVRLNIDPGHNFEFVLDDTYRMQQRSVKLKAGAHNFKLWAPERSIVDTTISVQSDQTLVFSMELPYSPEYQAYREEMGRFQRKFVFNKVVPSVLTLGSAIWTTVSFAQYKKANDALDDNRGQYDGLTVPWQINNLKEELAQNKDDLSQKETMFIISSSVLAASAVATFFLFRKAKRMEVPVFQDKAKLEFEGLVYSPGVNDAWGANFKLKF